MADMVRCTVCDARLKAENEAAHMRKVHPNVPFEAARSPPARDRLYLTAGTKKVVFALVAAVVLIVAGVLLLRNVNQSEQTDPTATAVHVSMSGFNPNTLTAKVGATLKVELINMDNGYHTDGGGWHDFVMPRFAMNMTVQPLGHNVFTVPTSQPGTYTWYCDICCGGKDNPSMIGTVNVVA